ncbi:MAG: DNA-processing protein DprA [Actinomycetota bacterium]
MPGERRRVTDLPRGWPVGFGRGEDERPAVVVLAALRSVRPRRLREIAWQLGSAQSCLAAVRTGKVSGPADRGIANTVDGEELLDRVAACGARVALPGDEEFDPRLLDLADPPAVLFVQGRVLAPGTQRVAIVGSRRPTDTGCDVAESLGAALAAGGVWVASGAAQGIDRAAHRGALTAGGPTVAVLAEGIGARHGGWRGSLLRKVADCGSILSECAPGVPADRYRFPARNRIVAALASAVVVVEGAERSGSLITAGHAADLGRAVLAVPGSVVNPQSAATFALLDEGARPVRHARDVCEAADIPFDEAAIAARRAALRGGVDPIEARVLDAVGDGVLPEHVADGAGLTLPDTLACLLRLELRGLVRSDGGRFRRSLDASALEPR